MVIVRLLARRFRKSQGESESMTNFVLDGWKIALTR